MAAQESLRQRIRQGIFDMGHVWLNEMKTLVKDEGVVIFFIIVPLLYPLLYSWAYNNEVVREVPVAVIDDSHSSLSRSSAGQSVFTLAYYQRVCTSSYMSGSAGRQLVMPISWPW